MALDVKRARGAEIPEVVGGVLPEWVECFGKRYYLVQDTCTDDRYGTWYTFRYEDADGNAADVNDGREWYRLVSMGNERRDALDSIFDKCGRCANIQKKRLI